MPDSLPYCECGDCDATSDDVRLPAEAWRVAGEGDPYRLAVAPGHDAGYRDGAHRIEDFGTWLAVGSAGDLARGEVVEHGAD